MSLSTTEANKILSHIFGGAAYTPEATWHVALFSASPGITGAGTNEITGGGYARVAVTNNQTNFPAAAAQAGSNGTAITFPTVTSGGYSATVTHLGLCASTTEGTSDVRHFAALSSPFIAVVGQAPKFAVGDLDWSGT